MRGVVILAAAVASLATAAAAAGPVRSPGVDRGAQVAQRDCAICHAIGPTGRSPNGAAPAFPGIARRYNPIGLEKALVRIARQGHFEMRPHALSEADAADLAAYIGDLGARR